MHPLTQFASETKGNIFVSLGIDWQMLILQIVAFLILVWGLGKFVYPWLIKSVDERQDKIEAAAKAAAEAQKLAEKSEENMEKLLAKARTEAAEIVNTARLESATALSASEEKAKTAAARIVADAHVQIDKDIIAAKKSLYNETIDLVALATKKVVGKTVSAKQNDALITQSLKESK